MATWIKADERMRVTDIRADPEDGWNQVRQDLAQPILTYDGIPLYAWDGADNALKRDDQSIARDRRVKKSRR